jgi:hypothetical protein
VLKKNRVHSPSEAFVPGLQVPLKVALFLCFGACYTCILYSNWRWWILDLTGWLALWLWLRLKLKRDPNYLGVMARSWIPKKLAFDDHIWGGITQFAWPVRDRTPTARGVPLRRRGRIA